MDTPESIKTNPISPFKPDTKPQPKQIESLVDDIYGVLSTPTVVSDQDAESFGQSLSRLITEKLAQPLRSRNLRMSNLGVRCKRRLYYSVNAIGEAEPLSPQTRLKFIYGDILEALLLFLAKASGHTVTGEQDELDINGVKGHRDAIIDGVTVDAKSASSRSFKKFEQGLTPESDAFGYLDQLGAYVYAGQRDDRVIDKHRGAFLAVDKQFGHLALDIHQRNNKDYGREVQDTRTILQSDKLPPRGYFDEPEGKSGNRKLGAACSYCEFKKSCWPGLRAFAYSSGPVFLTHVAKQPNVPEIGDVSPGED